MHLFWHSGKCVITAVLWMSLWMRLLFNMIDGWMWSCKWKRSLVLWDHQSGWHTFTSSFIMNTMASPFSILFWFRKQPHCLLNVSVETVPGLVRNFLLRFIFVFPFFQWPPSSHEEDRPANIMNMLALTASVNTANSILKCVQQSPKPLHVPPLCLLIAPSLLICHGESCVGLGKAWMLRQTNAIAICSGTFWY